MRTASVATFLGLGWGLLLVGGCPPSFSDLCTGIACGGDGVGPGDDGDADAPGHVDGGPGPGSVDAGTDVFVPTDAGKPRDAGPNPGIRCDDGVAAPPGTLSCVPATKVCCIATSVFGKTYNCVGPAPSECAAGGGGSSRVRVECDDDRDCTGGRHCCGHVASNRFDSVACSDTACTGAQLQLCHVDNECTGGLKCTGIDPGNPAYRFCKP